MFSKMNYHTANSNLWGLTSKRIQLHELVLKEQTNEIHFSFKGKKTTTNKQKHFNIQTLWCFIHSQTAHTFYRQCVCVFTFLFSFAHSETDKLLD